MESDLDLRVTLALERIADALETRRPDARAENAISVADVSAIRTVLTTNTDLVELLTKRGVSINEVHQLCTLASRAIDGGL